MILKNSGDSRIISLPKDIADEIRILLSWTKDTDAGFFQRMLGGDKVDLDLGCYYELRNGSRTLIDCLQFAADAPASRSESSRQGCYDQEPYIWHTGDNLGRDNEEEHVEEIIVNPIGLQQIRCITVYAYIFDGPASWDAFGAKVTLRIPGCEDIAVTLEGDGSKNRFCAAMHIDIDEDGSSIKVSKLGTLHLGHSDCDQAYGWGLRFRTM